MKQERTFSFSDVKSLIARHNEIENKLEELKLTEQKYNDKIKKTTGLYSASEVLKILKDIPIEEVNRDKKGIRVKALRENGFTNYADIFTASKYQIASVRGISEDGAYRIKKIVSEAADTAAKTTKLKLSADNRTADTTNIVMAVTQYQRASKLSNEAILLFEQNNIELKSALEEVRSATGFFKWLFTSSDKKQRVIKSYKYLQEKLNGEYGEKAFELEKEKQDLELISDEEAWNEFQKQPIRFTNILEETVPGMLGNQDAVYGLPEDLVREVQDECFFPDDFCVTCVDIKNGESSIFCIRAKSSWEMRWDLVKQYRQ